METIHRHHQIAVDQIFRWTARKWLDTVVRVILEFLHEKPLHLLLEVAIETEPFDYVFEAQWIVIGFRSWKRLEKFLHATELYLTRTNEGNLSKTEQAKQMEQTDRRNRIHTKPQNHKTATALLLQKNNRKPHDCAVVVCALLTNTVDWRWQQPQCQYET